MADTGTGGSACGDPVIGSRLGGYVIEAVLGRGAMGKVYRARQVSLDRPVALKVMISYLSQREDLVARFRREAMAAARLNHPNVVQVYDFVEAEGACFYVMELVDGLSLGDYLNRGERFSEREVIEVGREVTMALEAVHEAGIIHRDIKPGNLMLTSRGLIKLSDLGLARVHDLGTDVSLTLTGMNVGTPLYMAPEQAQGAKTVDGRADFYALGATLYHLAAGRPPFEGETPGAILMKQVHGSPPDARALNPSLGRGFADLLRWMMAARQEDRPGSHGAILAALDRCQDDVLRRKAAGPSRIVSSTLSPSPDEKGLPRGAKRWPIWGVFAGALAAIAVAGWLATRPEQEPKPPDVATADHADHAEHAENAEGTVSTTKGTGGTKDAQGVPVPAAPPPASPAAASPAPIPERMVEAPCAPETSNSKTETSPQGQTLTGSAAETPAARAKPLATQEELMVATKEKPFVNSLEMKFVPIPGTRVLFSIWETRVKDFEAFVKESGYSWNQKPGFDQGPDHPVVRVTWNDAKAFCVWLSKKEGLEYRLPTDEEWDAAVGREAFPWGREWPPPLGSDNFAGDESKLGQPSDPMDQDIINGYRDAHPRTAPVGSYKALKSGVYDLPGNVREFCEDWYTEVVLKKHLAGGGHQPQGEKFSDIMKGDVRKILRGGSWHCASRDALGSSRRSEHLPDRPAFDFGFRCVVVERLPFPADAGAAHTAAAPAAPEQTSPTKEKPFVNSLGMRFVSIPGTKVLFSIWETRVRDFDAFVKDSGYDWHEKPSFDQTPDHPVVVVNWNDAKAFCDWLSKKEGREYRLPTDDEWDAAVGKDKYPWGNNWPPPKDAENFAGEESKSGRKGDPRSVITGYRDGHSRTSPVGTYKATETGLYDISGNITEWIEDWYTEALYRKHREKGGYEMRSDELADVQKGNVFRVKRGGNWYFGTASSLVLSVRAPGRPTDRFDNIGFRCVVARSSPFPAVAEGTLVRTPAAVEATPAPAEKAAAEPSSATKEKPFVNSLGMKFVPVPGTRLLFCIWETRVKDFEVFVKESGYDWHQKPPFEQTPDHPVVRVSWNDAMAFCEWLSKKEGGQYRLPRDEEWDGAVGKAKYPWGGEWPPPNGVENNRGEELRDGGLRESRTVQFGYQDKHPNTAPVGCYRPSGLGLFDIGGNVREWVEDWYTSDLYTKHLKGGGLALGTEVISAIGHGSVYHVARGGNWRDYSAVFCVSSYRYPFMPDQREDYIGFRCALVASSRFPALVVPTLAAGGTGQTLTGSASIPEQLSGSRSLGLFTPDETKELDTILAPLQEAAASAEQAASDRIAKYMKDLEELEGKAAARSDLDAMVKLRKEREAWFAGGRVPKAEASARMPSEYNNLRYFLDRDLALIDGRAELALRRETADALSNLRAFGAKLTRAKRIEAALAVREITAKVEKGEVSGAADNNSSAKASDAIPASRPGARASDPRYATRDMPFVNSLGMRFVPVLGTKVLFSIWETRVKDFEAFVSASHYGWINRAYFAQTRDDPVVSVSWDGAKAFCAWLSKKEGLEYRLPTDDEWDNAVGQDRYPWGVLTTRS